MKIKFLLLLLLGALPLSAAGQNVRYDAQFPSVSNLFPYYLQANVPPNSPVIAVCHSPANALPCTNYLTTYNSAGVACPNGAQDTPQPQPSSCQATGDATGNIGFWAPAGTYDYTVCIQNNCFGPYTVTLGSTGGGGGCQFGSQYQTGVYTATNCLGSIGPGIIGQVPVSQGAAAYPAFTSAGLPDSTASPVTASSYTIQCDTLLTTVDRLRILRFQSGASAVTVPLSTATGCGGGFVTSVIDDAAGTLTFTRSSPDTFSVFGGASPGDGQTTFTLGNNDFATLTQGASGIWEVRITPSGSGATVVSFSAGNLSPLFTTSVANSTTTPALSFSLSNAAANTVFGNPTGSTGAPRFFTPYLPCQTGIGDGLNAIPAATYLQGYCFNDSGVTLTITGIRCRTDNSGSSTLTATDDLGNSLLTGAITCTPSFAAGTQSAHVTVLNHGFVEFTFISDGTSKETTWTVTQ